MQLSWLDMNDDGLKDVIAISVNNELDVIMAQGIHYKIFFDNVDADLRHAKLGIPIVSFESWDNITETYSVAVKWSPLPVSNVATYHCYYSTRSEFTRFSDNVGRVDVNEASTLVYGLPLDIRIYFGVTAEVAGLMSESQMSSITRFVIHKPSPPVNVSLSFSSRSSTKFSARFTWSNPSQGDYSFGLL